MNQKIMNKCIKLAKEERNERYNLCAIITDKRDKILSIAKNSYSKSHPKMKLYSQKYWENENRIYLHAEIRAILRLKENDKPFKIYIARTNKNGENNLLAKPCEICYNMIKKIGIKEENIFYTGKLK